MTALLIKFAPWLAGVLVVFGAGTYTGYHLNPWEGRYKSLQAADAIERMHGEEAVRAELTAQLAQAQATSKNNADSLARLADENAEIIRDRDANLLLARRLLASQAGPATTGHSLPQTTNQPGVATASDPAAPTKLEGLVVDVADGYERCVSQLNALIAQIKPQL